MTAYDTVVLADSPAQYLKLGEASGTNAADTSGNSRVGTYVAAPTLGQAGLLPSDVPAGGETCVLLNGTTQWVTVANAAWQQTAAATWEAWCRPTAAWAGSGDVVGQDTGINGTTRRIQLQRIANEIWQPMFGTVSSQITPNSDISAPTGRKCHVVLTNDGTTGQLFMNGKLLLAVPTTAMNTTTVTDILYWGANHASNPWKGHLEKCAIYPAVLSAARILAHFNVGINPFADAFASAGTLDEDWLYSQAGISNTGFDISGFGTEGSEPGGLAKTAWGIVNLPTSGNLTIDTTGSAFTATINVYTGSALGSLALVATGTTTLTVAVTANTVYRVQVGGAGGLLNYSFKYVPGGSQKGDSPISGVLPAAPTGHVFKGHGSYAADTASVA